MDPYLERHWLDVHASLITSSRNALNARLPEDLIARAEERVDVEAAPRDALGRGRRKVGPDVRVFETVSDGTAPPGGGTAVAIAPYRLELLDDPVTERYIEIIDVRGGEKLITVIEFVGPTNKTDGLPAFVRKRNELLSGGVNFVEIDLVRAGDWERLLRPHGCPPEAFSAVFRFPGDSTTAYLHPMPLRQALPTINIPLRPGDQPCELPLQPLIDDAYKNSRYGSTIDYRRPCEPPLEDEDAAWVDELLRKAGRR